MHFDLWELISSFVVGACIIVITNCGVGEGEKGIICSYCTVYQLS